MSLSFARSLRGLVRQRLSKQKDFSPGRGGWRWNLAEENGGGLRLWLPDPFEQPAMLVFVHLAGDGVAEGFEAGEIPEVRKFPALLRLDRLHRAIVAIEEDAFAVWLVEQGQAVAIQGETGEALDELQLAQPAKGCEPGDLSPGQSHLSRPATAGRAALALEKDRHVTRIQRDAPVPSSQPDQAEFSGQKGNRRYSQGSARPASSAIKNTSARPASGAKSTLPARSGSRLIGRNNCRAVSLTNFQNGVLPR